MGGQKGFSPSLPFFFLLRLPRGRFEHNPSFAHRSQRKEEEEEGGRRVFHFSKGTRKEGEKEARTQRGRQRR